MLYEFMGGKCLSIVKRCKANFANNWTIAMNPRNMLTQIIFKSNRFPLFARMTAFLVNYKLERFPDDVVLTHSSHDRFLGWCFSGGVCWWGRVNILIWWCSWDVAVWRLNFSHIVNNHWCVPALVFGCTWGSSVSKNIFSLMLVSSMRA